MILSNPHLRYLNPVQWRHRLPPFKFIIIKSFKLSRFFHLFLLLLCYLHIIILLLVKGHCTPRANFSTWQLNPTMQPPTADTTPLNSVHNSDRAITKDCTTSYSGEYSLAKDAATRTTTIVVVCTKKNAYLLPLHRPNRSRTRQNRHLCLQRRTHQQLLPPTTQQQRPSSWRIHVSAEILGRPLTLKCHKNHNRG